MKLKIEEAFQQAVSSHKKGNLRNAALLYSVLLKAQPSHIDAQYNLAMIMADLGRLDDAELGYRRAIAMKPDHSDAHNNLGLVLQKMGRLDEAEASFRQSIALRPAGLTYRNLGNALQDRGRLGEAEENYIRAVAMRPGDVKAHRYLASLKKFSSKDEQFLQMELLYRDSSITDQNRCHLCFGLAKACEDVGDFASAFKFFAEGNAIRKKILGYDREKDAELFRKLRVNYPGIAACSWRRRSSTIDILPIFIVGMPRSGTTLVEQIISSHSLVTGAGELNFVAELGHAIATGKVSADNDSVERFREQYLMAVQSLSDDCPYVIDKMPQNFRYLGLITAALPEAKIIHVMRDPAAVCWGNYSQYFADDAMGYCYGLDDILSYHKLYRELMEFWRCSLPVHIYDLDYELLTVNQEDETRKLVDNLGLTWEAACSSPQNNSRAVTTASNAQVRQKVYQGSSGCWRRYQPYLNGALDQFG